MTKAVAATNANPVPQSLRSLCYLLFKASWLACVGEALCFWRGDSISRASRMTKAVAATNANAVPESPSFPLLPLFKTSFACLCGRGALFLAWRFDKPSVGHDKAVAATNANPMPQSPSFPLLPSVQTSCLACVGEALGAGTKAGRLADEVPRNHVPKSSSPFRATAISVNQLLLEEVADGQTTGPFGPQRTTLHRSDPVRVQFSLTEKSFL
jgi:hypothetical protein